MRLPAVETDPLPDSPPPDAAAYRPGRAPSVPTPFAANDTLCRMRADVVAAACVRAAVEGHPRGVRGMSSGWAQDRIGEIMRLLSELSGVAPPWYGGDTVAFYVHRDHSGARIWCETEHGAFDHIVGEMDALEFERLSSTKGSA